ncbi:MAG: PHP domain-containing protein [Brevinematales bacterium]|nr:PHP domain-containing protein [Brevinematales bacterium]
MTLKADFHIHSCLSPCALLTMSPKKIIEVARDLGLNAIAITDHNSSKNNIALKNLFEKYKDFYCLFGMELTVSEEFHTLCLFDNLEAALKFDDMIYNSLPYVKNVPEKMGSQVIVDENDYVVGEVDKYLGIASNYSFEAVYRIVNSLSGVCIPSHIERDFYGVLYQLGYLPPLSYVACEVSYNAFKNASLKTGKTSFKSHDVYIEKIKTSENYISSSDSHNPDDIGRIYLEIEVNKFSLEEIKNSFSKQNYEIILRKF